MLGIFQKMSKILTQALHYHRQSPAGKVALAVTKPCRTQADLALAYTPGVAEPARAIARRPADVYQYTAKGNLVGVISNGTAVLGLGNIGAAASKPVMEGKAVLFKRFAGIDAFDLEVNCADPEKFVELVAALAPTFGAINLEDIAAPECFYIEEELQRRIDIPVFHDDQHGTAIITGAALLNALKITGKKINQVKVIVAGAGAAGIRCAEHYVRLGVSKKNIWLCDSKGLITMQRRNLNKYKQPFAHRSKPMILAEVMVKADVFVGVSAPNIVTPKMLQAMAPRPIVFALANPDPEIAYPLARRSRRDILLATGRSDYPNQINNALCFPFLLRGALDAQAHSITPNMKLAATAALAELGATTATKLVPSIFDKRLLPVVAAAVVPAAQRDGVARKKINLQNYVRNLQRRRS